MDDEKRLYIHNRREMVILLLLAVLLAIFTFTLGVHFGKKLFSRHSGAPLAGALTAETQTAHTQADPVPNRMDLTEQGKTVAQNIENTLDQSLHEEVVRTGIKIDKPRQVELPKNVKKPNAPAAGAPVAIHRDAPRGRFTLQIGSHQSMEDAQKQVKQIEGHGITPYIREVEVKNIGKRYRVYFGGFVTQVLATQEGDQLKSKHIIDGFLVAKFQAE